MHRKMHVRFGPEATQRTCHQGRNLASGLPVLRHSGARVFTVAIGETAGGDLKITVIDDGCAETVPHLGSGRRADGVGGRGMRLVDELAKQWGFTRERAVGLAVWFVLEGCLRPAGDERT
jgi:hypothetical protein